MASARAGNRPSDAIPSIIQPYRIHVSQRYLDLTKQKLELTRLPRDPPTNRQDIDVGTPKSQLEPLIDHWSYHYDWRAQEAFYNDTLPQYRISLQGPRLHYVHKRSEDPHAIPLLFVHGWLESFIAVSSMVDALCKAGDDVNEPSFHVVAPSIPGFGFSDQVAEEGNNIATTTEVFDTLMKTLGYTRYIAHGSGW
jgi:pimeloyl-ACP methyl ester carboxylesterase